MPLKTFTLLLVALLFSVTNVYAEPASPCVETFLKGKAELEANDYDKSKITLTTAITLCKGKTPHEARAYRFLGNAYYMLHDYEAASRYYSEAESLFSEEDDPIEVGRMHRNLGNIAFEDKDYKQARKYYGKARDAERAAKEPLEEAEVLINLGRVEFRTNNLSKAIGYYMQATNLGLKVQGKLYTSLAQMQMGKTEPALKNVEEALKLAIKDNDKINTARGYYYKGLVLYESKDMDGALTALKNSAELFEEMRLSLLTERSRALFWEDKMGIYEKIIEILVVEKKDYKEAWRFAEKIKGRAFLDMMGTKEINVKYSEGGERTAELIRLDRELLEELVGGATNQEESSMEDVLEAYEVNLTELREVAPEYVSLRSADVIPFDELTAILTEDDASLIEYYIGLNNFYIWTINPDGSIHAVKGTLPVSTLNAKIEEATNKAKRPNFLSSDFAEEFQELNHDLYNALFLPVRETLQKKRVYVVAHGKLHHYPIQSLIVEKNEIPLEGQEFPHPTYLIEEGYLFAYLPSASILQVIEKKDHGELRPLIIGNPEYAKEAKLKPLAGAEEEAKYIGSEILHVAPMIGSEATETWVKSNIKDYNYLLFATHGALMRRDPLASAIYLTKDESNDGSLTVAEIFDLDIDAELVVLSACETGKVGNLTGLNAESFSEGDDLIGIARAFIYAGTETILSTLWKVSDKASKELNIAFHENRFIENQSTIEAITNASLKMIKDAKKPDANSPFIYTKFWAPFVMIGRF